MGAGASASALPPSQPVANGGGLVLLSSLSGRLRVFQHAETGEALILLGPLAKSGLLSLEECSNWFEISVSALQVRAMGAVLPVEQQLQARSEPPASQHIKTPAQTVVQTLARVDDTHRAGQLQPLPYPPPTSQRAIGKVNRVESLSLAPVCHVCGRVFGDGHGEIEMEEHAQTCSSSLSLREVSVHLKY
jgi:hypothetical protein